MKRILAILLIAVLLIAASAMVFEQLAPLPGSNLPATDKGQPVRVEVTRDTWVSSYEGEEDANLGGADRLKFKGIQEFSLLDLDVNAIKGRAIVAAALHLHTTSSDPLRRMTVSTLASEWTEGTRRWYDKEPGSASFRWAAQEKKPWAYEGSDITAAALGGGQTRWRFSNATVADANGFQSIAVDPTIIAARVAGVSHGVVVFDDVGSEWERRGETFLWRSLLNRYVSSREAGRRKRPYFTVILGEEDEQPPGPVTAIESKIDALPQGEAMVSWLTPSDAGSAGTIGFQVRVAQGDRFDWLSAAEVRRDLIPLAGKAGARVVMHLRDLPEGMQGEATIGIRAVDGAGNIGAVAVERINLSKRPRVATIGGEPAKMFPAVDAASAPLPSAAGVTLCIVDGLDKVQAITGDLIPPRPAAYRHANHLWSAGERRIQLHTARNEFTTFQAVIQGPARGATISVRMENPSLASPRFRLFRGRTVASNEGPLPDPLIELREGETLEIPAADGDAAARIASIFVEAYVPHEAAAGNERAVLTLAHANERVEIPIDLRIWNFTLPDHLSFIPQMNCYSLPGPPGELHYYRLAHEHRTCLNRVPYNWQGKPSQGRAPIVVTKGEDLTFRFEDHDKRFGPLLDGSAFKDLPRKNIPVDAFYLPLNENWPMDINAAFAGSYWADEALGAGYWRGFSQAAGAFASHIQSRGWRDTIFECYLNNKVFHKQGGWSNSSALWVFDEPVNTQDFWALRCFGMAFNDGVRHALTGEAQPAKLAFRADISRPQWQRDMLDGVIGVNVVGGGVGRYDRMVLDRKRKSGEVTYAYGGSTGIAGNNASIAAWCVDSWCVGLDGVIPWQTLGKMESWQQADVESLFYPGGPIGSDRPVPSLRLKAYTRGQQDVEYLTMFSLISGQQRDAVGLAARQLLKPASTFTKTHEEDAGTISFGELDGVALWKIRTQVGALIDAAAPPFKRKLIDLNPRMWEREPNRELGKVVAP